MASKHDDLTKGTCAAEGCARGVRNRELCGMHYQRFKRSGSLEKPLRVSWNRGLTIADPRVRKSTEAATRARVNANIPPWNKGLTQSDPRVAAAEAKRRESRTYERVYEDARARSLANYHRMRVERDPLGLISREQNARQRVKRSGAYAEPIDYRLILDRDGWVCGICGNGVIPDDLSFDHIKSIGSGGDHIAENVQVAHAACNSRKGEEEFRENRLLVVRKGADDRSPE